MFFREVIGQEFVKSKLLQTAQSGRIAHAQLFLGESGTGALPLALAYAQYVNCKNPLEQDSCGECESCRKMISLEHPDVHFAYPSILKDSDKAGTDIEILKQFRQALKENPYLDYVSWMNLLGAENKQGNINAAACRYIIRKLSLKPLYDGYKMLVLWLPEYLGKEGNILLKILEEPPANTLFLLVAQDEEQIISTILSRTQMIRIPRLTDEQVKNALIEKLNTGEEEAARMAYLANGSFSLAQKLLGQAENNYSEEFIQWLRQCYKPTGAPLLKWVDRMAGTGRENQKNFLNYGLGLLRECFIYSHKLENLNRALDSEQDFVKNFSALLHEENLFGLSENLSQAHYYIERNANPKILFFNLSLRIHQLLKRKATAVRH